MKKYLVLASFMGFLAVLFGAFGAHYLEPRVSARMADVWGTAVNYQMYHALAILVVSAVFQQGGKLLRLACMSFLLGVLLFSGSLYLLVITGETRLGMITPMGGTLFLLGWLLLCFAFAGKSSTDNGK